MSDVHFYEHLGDVIHGALFLPPRGSTFAANVDHLHYFVIIAALIAGGVCGGAALILYLRNRRTSEQPRTGHVVASFGFEAGSVILPLSFFLTWWVIGFRIFISMHHPPASAMDVYVTAKQWMWKFSYPNGPNAVEALHVPAHRPVRLLITSRDVIHSFFVPAFRIKQDAIPGRYTDIWFEATKTGRYRIMCAEMCGIGHSFMFGEVVVHEPAEFDEWISEQRRGLANREDMGRTASEPPASDLVDEGRLIAARAGCLKCHSVDGTPHIGPTWQDLYQRAETMSDGRKITADDAYLTKSMMDPLADLVAGYEPVMPTYQGRLSAPEIGALVEYIKSLTSPAGVAAQPKGPVYEPTRSGPAAR